MRLIQDFLDRSKQLNQTPCCTEYPAYHAPNRKYKIIHQALILPNLPAPFHYLNFSSMIGQPNATMLANLNAVQKSALDTATVICSTSPHMVGQCHSYSIEKDCTFQPQHFQFSDREILLGGFPHFKFRRQDTELEIQLNIQTCSLISYFTYIRFGLAEHWSVLCQCEGNIKYQGQYYELQALGNFEYARSINFPYLPFSFFTYQIVTLSHNRQILMMQVRDHLDHIIQSRLYLRDLDNIQTQLYDQDVHFKIHRVYPLVITPNAQRMYLPREFEWSHVNEQGQRICIKGQSRGDFKFGLAAGYVGSFEYQIEINGEIEYGAGGYCEYVDCRDLIFQEQNKNEKVLDYLFNPAPIMAKNP